MTERNVGETIRAYINNRRFARLKAQNSRLCSIFWKKKTEFLGSRYKKIAFSGKLEIRTDANYNWCNTNCLEISVNCI